MGLGLPGPPWHPLAAGCWRRWLVGSIVFQGRWVARPLTLVLASACSLLEKSALVEAPVHDLAPGQFVWLPERAPAGLVEIVVSLASQRAWVFRSGTLIGTSTVSSGRRGYESPVGRFEILQKRKVHRSNRYENAPMPYMQRLKDRKSTRLNSSH